MERMIVSISFILVSCGSIRYDATEPLNTEPYNNANYENENFNEEAMPESKISEIVPDLPTGRKAQCCIGSIFKLYQGSSWGRERYSNISMGVCFENSTSTTITPQMRNEFRIAANIIGRHPKNKLIAFVLQDTKNIELAKMRIKISENYLIRIGLSKKQIIIQ